MILGLFIMLALAVRFGLYGFLDGLDALRVRGESLLLVVFVLTIGLPWTAALMPALRPVVYPAWVAVMVVLLAVCIANTGDLQGFRLMATGVAMNLVVIVFSGAMPVSREALLSVGSAGALRAVERDFFHVLASTRTPLPLLADVLPLPGPPGLRSVQSAGDVLMLVGILLVVAQAPCARARHCD